MKKKKPKPQTEKPKDNLTKLENEVEKFNPDFVNWLRERKERKK